jgi:hypothetical protein
MKEFFHKIRVQRTMKESQHLYELGQRLGGDTQRIAEYVGHEPPLVPTLRPEESLASAQLHKAYARRKTDIQILFPDWEPKEKE